MILAAGAYGSPGILMRSGIGPAESLRSIDVPLIADLGGVGQNLIDHPGITVDLPYRGDIAPAPKFQVVGTFHSVDQAVDDAPDLQCLVYGPGQATGERPASFFVAATLLKPRSRGTVHLRSANPADAPVIELGYFSEPDDLVRIAAGLDRVSEVARQPAFATLAGAPLAEQALTGPERDGWIRRNAWTYHHPVGTCAMGPDASAGAVVDSGGRVHGIDGLFVADASVMPDIPSANTHLPTIMVAERLSDLIAARL